MRANRPIYCLQQGRRPVIPRVWVARTFRERALGLMFRRSLPEGEALYLPGCRAVHTFCMRFSLDIRFLDGHGRIVRTVWNLKPWRIAWGGRRAVAALETTAGHLPDAIIDSRQPLALVVVGTPAASAPP